MFESLLAFFGPMLHDILMTAAYGLIAYALTRLQTYLKTA
jgi:hypothetical protein